MGGPRKQMYTFPVGTYNLNIDPVDIDPVWIRQGLLFQEIIGWNWPNKVFSVLIPT